MHYTCCCTSLWLLPFDGKGIVWHSFAMLPFRSRIEHKGYRWTVIANATFFPLVSLLHMSSHGLVASDVVFAHTALTLDRLCRALRHGRLIVRRCWVEQDIHEKPAPLCIDYAQRCSKYSPRSSLLMQH